MKLLAKELGVDVLTFKTLCNFDNPVKGEELLPRCGEYRRFEYDGEGKPERVKNTCKKMWNHPTVYRDGSFYTCDYHSSRDPSLGNVFTDGGGVGKIWFGKGMRELRARFLKGDVSGLRCESCPWNFSEVDRFVSHAFGVSKTYSDMYPGS
jgi:radical SAM protein with 4Fe4S-binding SPASM domain